MFLRRRSGILMSCLAWYGSEGMVTISCSEVASVSTSEDDRQDGKM